jgi:hypothetical protein
MNVLRGRIITFILLIIAAVCSVNKDETILAQAQQPYTGKAKSAVIKLLLPAHVKSREPFRLQGTISGRTGLRQVSVFLDGRSYAVKQINDLASIDLNDLAIDIVIPKPGTCRLLVRAYVTESAAPFTDREVDLKVASYLGEAPKITLNIPRQIIAGEEIAIAGTVTDRETEVKRVTLFIDGKKVSEKDFTGKKSVQLESVPWNIKIESPGSYSFRVRAFDDPDREPMHFTDATCTIKVRELKVIR